MESSIDIVLPEFADILSPWREETIEVATKGVPPHVTLVYPWRTPPIRDNDITELAAILKSLRPFQLSFSRLSRFPDGTVYLALDQEDFVKSLIRELAKSFPDTPLYGGAFLDPVPHLTVAKAPSPKEAEEMEASNISALSSKLPLHATVQTISVMVENQKGIWSVHYQNTLNA